MGRNYLWYRQRDAINAVMAAGGYNVRLLILLVEVFMVPIPHGPIRAPSIRFSRESGIFTDDLFSAFGPVPFLSISSL